MSPADRASEAQFTSREARRAAAIFAGAALLALALSARAAVRLPESVDFVRGRYAPEVPRPGGEGPFTFEKLVDLARANRTLEATIAALPEHLRSRYVLMYDSRSLQKASFQAPRAILFEDDARFVVSFNGGDPKTRGHDKLEAVQFRDDGSRWEFREIDFASGEPRVSEPNPRKCLECHQSARRADVDPRPNWEPYFFWPGAYGGVDGQPGRTMEGEYPRDPETARLLAPLIASQRAERENLAAFERDVKPTHPRYRVLGAFVPRQTLDFTDALVDLNVRRVARLASRTPNWDLYRDWFGASLFCGSTPDDGSNLPSELAAAHSASYEKTRASRPGTMAGRGNARRVDYFFESRGIDTSDWSMDFKTGGRFAFNDRFGSPSFPESQMVDGFVRQLGESSASRERLCDEYGARAKAREPEARASGRLAALAREVSQPSGVGSLPEADAPAMLARCAVCHVGPGRTGPALPFDDLGRLKAALGRTGYLRGSLLEEIEFRVGDVAGADEQMPPGPQPTPAERSRLLRFLRAL